MRGGRVRCSRMPYLIRDSIVASGQQQATLKATAALGSWEDGLRGAGLVQSCCHDSF